MSAPETSASVPVSAIPAKAADTALRSRPSDAPCRISSDVSLHGMAARRASAPMRSVAGQLFSRKKRATSAGASVHAATSAMLACARSASSLKIASRAEASPCPRFGDDAGRRLHEARFDFELARRFVAAHAERAANVGEDRLAGVHLTAPLLPRHWLWNVAPCGAARSRYRVQPPAKGAQENRPLPRPMRCMARAARSVERR